MHDDLSLLTTALGLAPTHRAALEARLPAAGGVLGLWHAGPEVLGSALPARARPTSCSSTTTPAVIPSPAPKT